MIIGALHEKNNAEKRILLSLETVKKLSKEKLSILIVKGYGLNSNISDQELIDISRSFTPQKMEFIKAGGSYAIVFGKKLQAFAAKALDKKLNKNGSKLLELGNTALNNQDFKVAIKCFDDVVLKSNSLEYKFEAKNKKLFADSGIDFSLKIRQMV